MTRGRTGAALLLLLPLACGKLAPPVRASQVRKPAAAVPATAASPSDAADDEREGKR